MNTFTEKDILTDALDAQKAATSLYNLSANECACNELKSTIMNILKDEHDMQFDVFTAMHERGFYPTPAAEMQKISEAKQTYAASYK